MKTILRSIWRKYLPSQVRQVLHPGLRIIAERERVVRRRNFALSYYRKALAQIDDWASRKTEDENFYYDLTALNRGHLAGLVSMLTHSPTAAVEDAFRELDTDEVLRTHLKARAKDLGFAEDIQFAYGRRLGWYALVRLLKPRVVIETGVHHGLGGCVLCAALIRNGMEGHPGRYHGTEIRTDSGQLVSGCYAEVGEVLYGDSIFTLEAFPAEIDLFINDSDHSADYEYREYQTIVNKLSKRAVIIGDNSHVTDSLLRFARETGRCFIFFREEPKGHWYPGAGAGFAFSRELICR